MGLLEYRGDYAEPKRCITKQGSEGWESGDLGSRNKPTVYFDQSVFVDIKDFLILISLTQDQMLRRWLRQ